MPKAHNSAVSTSAMTMVAANVIHRRCIAVPDGLVVPVFCDVSDTVCTTATVGRYGVGWVSVFGGSIIPMRYCADSHRIGNRFLGQIALFAGQTLHKSEIQIQRVL